MKKLFSLLIYIFLPFLISCNGCNKDDPKKTSDAVVPPPVFITVNKYGTLPIEVVAAAKINSESYENLRLYVIKVGTDTFVMTKDGITSSIAKK